MTLAEKGVEFDVVPRTFQERGVAIPFTTPVLAQARARIDRAQRLEFLVPHPHGGRRRHVLTWAALSAATATTVHDRRLHHALTPAAVQNPNAVREAALALAADGLAGPRVARRAVQTREQERQAYDLNRILLVARLLKLLHLPAGELLRDGIEKPGLESRYSEALARVMTELRFNRHGGQRRLETLASLIVPIGLPEAPERGRLAVLAREVGEFALQARSWAEGTPALNGRLGSCAADVAELTCGLTDGVLRAIDKELESTVTLMRHWEERLPGLSRMVTRVAWLLDGWGYIIALWQQAAVSGEEARGGAINEVFRVLPQVPRSELGTESSAADSSGSGDPQLQALYRQAGEAVADWCGDPLDYARVRGIEAIRALMR